MKQINTDTDLVAMILRIGLGLVFMIGGLNKLSLLLGSGHDAMVTNYMGSSGYINSLFQDYLFGGGDASSGFLSPSVFLTSLSAFELFCGIAFVLGWMVRPLSLFYGFLLWTFVVALPTSTVPQLTVEVKTYTSPAMMVQIRDITLSGFMFVLYNLGAGKFSVDNTRRAFTPKVHWNSLGLLLRLSLAVSFVVGGFFHDYAKIANFATPAFILAPLSLLLIFGTPLMTRVAGAVVVAIMLWFMVHKFSFDKSLIANLNGFKREFAFIGAGSVLALYGGGLRYTIGSILDDIRGVNTDYRQDSAVAE